MYSVTRILSTTETGMLCRATRLRDHHPVLLNVAPQFCSPEDGPRLASDFAACRAISGSGILAALALETFEGRPALVLEDFDGDPLEARLGRPFAIGTFLETATRITGALAAIHRCGAAHCALAPANVLLHRITAEARIIGLGCAAMRPDSPIDLARRLDIDELRPYLAPEQTGRLNRTPDMRSDLYALGVIFYQMLTGTLPFSANGLLEWVYCHIARIPPSPDQITPSVPGMLGDIVVRLLAKDPGERYQSAYGLLRDLHACMRQWEANGAIQRFELGSEDVPEWFRMPRKLYGREREVDVLRGAFERIARGGGAELVLVQGAYGTGKSALVEELRMTVARGRGFFAAGKFGQGPQDMPYAAFLDAMAGLVQHILGESEEQLGAWKRQLRHALGSHARLMVDVLPSLGIVLGPQPAVPPLPPAEERSRFMNACVQFLCVFARPPHPLVLFLDDLQQADDESLALLEHLGTQARLPYFLPIYACRDQDAGAGAGHGRLRLDRLSTSETRLTCVEVGALGHNAVCALLGETLHCSRSDVEPLARMLAVKTGANPRFLTEFLAGAHARGLFEFDQLLRVWRWDSVQIQACHLADNMADAMADRLGSLLPASMQAMEHFACLGMRVDADRLAISIDCAEPDLHLLLSDAVGVGLIARDGAAYCFLHQHIRDAALAFLGAEDRARTCLQIGRRLLRALPPEQIESNAADIASQFNLGMELLTDPEERDMLLRLNLLAGRKAKASGMFASACGHFRHAIALLPSSPWECRYEDALAAHLELAECEFFAGNADEAEELCSVMFMQARSDIDRASVYSLRINYCHAAGRYEESVAAGIEALALFGITFQVTRRQIKRAEAGEARRMTALLNGREPEELLHAVPATDPAVIAAIGLLVDSLPGALLAGKGLAALLVRRAVNLSLQYGRTEKSCFAFGCLAVIETGRRNIESGQAWARLALRLVEQYGAPGMRGRLLYLYGSHVSFWRDCFAVNVGVLENALRACAGAGDTVWAAYVAGCIPWRLIEKGTPLAEVATRIEELSAQAASGFNDTTCHPLRTARQFVACLQGGSNVTLSDDSEDCEGHDAAARSGPLVAYGHALRQMSLYLSQQYEQVLEHAHRLAATHGAMIPMSSEALACSFYEALSIAALFPEAMPELQQEFTERLRRLRDRHECSAQSCPANFAAPHALISAETAAIEGRDLEAMQGYERAIRLSSEHGLLHIEAFANECAARFYHGRGYGGSAGAYLSNAYACHERWGAAGKLRQLELSFPQLRRSSAAGTGKRDVRAHLDALATMKALHTLAGETAVDRLMNKLLRVMIELAGAQKGYLIMPRDSGLNIEAMAALDSSGRMEVRQLHDMRVATSFLAPASIIQHAWRAKQRILLDDARIPSRFSSDTYILDSRPKSILCQPIFMREELFGLIYLENNLVTAAFSHGAAESLDMIASQAAISLETARLYSDLAEENAQRRRVELELQHSEAHYRRLFETAKDGIMLVDTRSGRIIDVNSRLILMIGCDYADLMGRSFSQSGPFADAAIYQPVFERLQSEGAVHYECLPLQVKDGRCLDIEFIGSAYHVGDACIFQCNIRDITDRKRAEQHQAVQLAVTRILAASGSLADAAPALVRIIGQKLGWELAEMWEADVHADALSLLSHWAAPLPGLPGAQDAPHPVLPFGDAEFPRQALQTGGLLWFPGDRMSAAGRIAACALPILKFEKIRCVMAFHASQPRALEDQTVSTLRMLADLIGQFIERRDIELALITSEERFRSLTALSSDWYWEQDADLRFIHLSEGIERKGGGLAEQLLGKARHELDIDWEATDPVAWALHEDAMQQREPFMNLEYRVMGVDGCKRWYCVSGEPVFDAAGRFQGYRGVGKEITDRKDGEAMQAALAQALEMIAGGAMPEMVLAHLARLIEGRSNGVCVAVMLPDDDGRRWHVAAAPSLPSDFRKQLEGMHASPDATTFGAAMARRERIAVFDIVQDPHGVAWTGQWAAALQAGFLACCSTPILSRLGRVLGSFDMYCRDARRFEEAELHLADGAARIAGMAIARSESEALPGTISRHDSLPLNIHGVDMQADPFPGET